MNRSFVLLAVSACAVSLAASPSPDQGLERAPTPIEVYVSAASASTPPPAGVPPAPLVVPSGSAVRIHGKTVPFGGTGAAQQVRVAVQPPAGAAVVLAAPVAADLRFTVTFTASQATGPYRVTATAPDGRATATAVFTVATAAEIGTAFDTVVRSFERLGTEIEGGLAAVQASLDQKGPYPNQAQVNQNLARITAALREHPAHLATARQALARVADVARQYPAGARELEPMVTATTEATQQADAAGERLRSGTAAVRRDSGLCDAIDTAVSVLGAASLSFDLMGRYYEKVIQLATDKFLPDRIYDAANPVGARGASTGAQRTTGIFALGETLKAVGSALGGAIGGEGGARLGAAGGMVDFLAQPKNLAHDTEQLVMSLVFDHFCEQFTGPLTGTFKLDATTNGQKFWGYTMTLSGLVTARYETANPRPGEPVAITGELEGNGSWAMYEDLMALNPYNRKFVLFNFLLPPIGWSAAFREWTDPLGKLARMATPAYFRVPITGSVRTDQLTIKVADRALVDFTDFVQGTALYVVLPQGLPAPYIMKSPIPVQKAQFVLSRGLRVEAVLPIRNVGEGRSMIRIAEKGFDRRDVVANGEITVVWHIDLKACNPSCPAQ